MHPPFSALFHRLIPVLFLAFLLTACAALGPPRPRVEVSLADIQVLEIRPLEAVLGLSLRIMNPDDTPLEVKGLNCRLKVDGRDFASGVAASPATVPAYGTAVLPVTVYASTLQAFGSVLSILQDREGAASPPLNYEISGTIRLGGSLNRAVDFSGRGELALPGAK